MEKGLAGYPPSVGSSLTSRRVCGLLPHTPLRVSRYYTTTKLPIPHIVYRQILYSPARLPYLTTKRPHCHIGIHRWQTISGDKGSDNQTKTPPAGERLSHNTKRKPLVCFLFDLKKEVFCVCPLLPKKGSSWWISFFLSHLFYVILVLSFLILITFLIYSALKYWYLLYISFLLE